MIPDKYISTIKSWCQHIPWNKNKKYKNTDHLKVPKTITDKVLNNRKLISETKRNKSSKIQVLDKNLNILGEWRSVMDLYEWSLTSNNNLPINFIGKIKNKTLLPQNILEAVKVNRPYKNLYFKFI